MINIPCADLVTMNSSCFWFRELVFLDFIGPEYLDQLLNQFLNQPTNELDNLEDMNADVEIYAAPPAFADHWAQWKPWGTMGAARRTCADPEPDDGKHSSECLELQLESVSFPRRGLGRLFYEIAAVGGGGRRWSGKGGGGGRRRATAGFGEHILGCL